MSVSLITLILAASTPESHLHHGAGPGHDHRVDQAVTDPNDVGPFQWLELVRSDFRPSSPLTEQSYVVAPAVPLVTEGAFRGVLLLNLRGDELAPNEVLAATTDGAGTFRRYEVGLPLSYRLSPTRALRMDARIAYGAAADEWSTSGLAPQITAGAAWVLNRDWTLTTEVLWGRTVLNGIPVPVVGFFYRPAHGRLRFDALLPRYAELAYRVTDDTELFTMAHWETFNWRVSATEEADRWLQRQEIRAQVGVRRTLFGPIALEASAHYVPLQQLALRSGPRDTFLGGGDFFVGAAVVLNTTGPVQADSL
ncbi:MAG: hypothetical protein AAF654_13960 [Myxococcota bacterium]